MVKLLPATGDKRIDTYLLNNEEYSGDIFVEVTDDIYDASLYVEPDILILSSNLNGGLDVITEALKTKETLPRLKIIIVLPTDVDREKIESLIEGGIYDIYISNSFSQLEFLEAIKRDKSKSEAEDELLYGESNKEATSTPMVEAPAYRQEEAYKTPEETYDYANDTSVDARLREVSLHGEEIKEGSKEFVVDKLSIISSIKPGTGKSFLSVNIAACIARYGKKINGRPPRVALIEGDLQNLSVGTLLQIQDEKKNLKTVMDKIATIVKQDGEFIGDMYETQEVNNFIKESFLPYKKVKGMDNLRCLVGSQLSFSEIENINSHYYSYLVDAIQDDYDVIIVDTNSALTHVTTYTLLEKAKNCFYVLNLDFNNVKNNLRYRDTLNEIGVLDKVQYILNEDIVDSSQFKEKLEYTSAHIESGGFKLAGKVPVMDKAIFLNRVFNAVPIILDEGNKYADDVRYEIKKVANTIYPIEDFEKETEKREKKKGFFGRR